MASKTDAFAYSRKTVNGHQTFTQKYAGKIMAYIALGKIIDNIYSCLESEYSKLTADNCISNGWLQNRLFENNVFGILKNNYNEEDILTTFHYFIQNKLCESIIEYFKGIVDDDGPNLCLCGGSFLNIKWNSAIRELGTFKDIYVPPFVNDTGIAIGAICAQRIKMGENVFLNWNTYLGPKLNDKSGCVGWKEKKCSIGELAKIIAFSEEPVILLNGRSELGPRALGNRSIIADARCITMKDKLNNIKCREFYRPIAPICIEEDAKKYFFPGIVDKNMLFEHKMTIWGANKVPAIMHTDGTARLQTVSKDDNSILYELLCQYKKITGVSVLCNTSANDNGKGFFPDVYSAQKWGKIKYIWSENRLYYYET